MATNLPTGVHGQAYQDSAQVFPMGYEPYREAMNHPNHWEAFQSINAHPAFSQVSFEELRAQDYAHDKSGASGPPFESAFTVPPTGLGSVSIPATWQKVRSKRAAIAAGPVLGGDFVTFRVGNKSPKDFVIHQALAESKSSFVQMSLKGEWKEAQERVIPLPEDEPEVFQLYQQWVYGGAIYSNHFSNGAQDAEEYEVLVKAYILGDRLLDSVFKDTVINCILDRLYSTRTFNPRLSLLVYENTPAGSPLRRLWRDVSAWLGGPSWLDQHLLGEPVHPEFSEELSALFLSFWKGQRPDVAPFARQACSYHEHAEGACADPQATSDAHTTANSNYVLPGQGGNCGLFGRSSLFSSNPSRDPLYSGIGYPAPSTQSSSFVGFGYSPPSNQPSSLVGFGYSPPSTQSSSSGATANQNSLFGHGGNSGPSGQSSLFGPVPNQSSLFSQTGGSGLFGQSSLFSSAPNGNALFGQSQNSLPSTGSNVFSSTSNQNSLFGQAGNNGSYAQSSLFYSTSNQNSSPGQGGNNG